MIQINYESIYEEKTTVHAYPGADLSGMQRKFLDIGSDTLESYGLAGVRIGVETVSSGGFFKSKVSEALVLKAQFRPYEFTGVVTVNTFGSVCVIGAYNCLEGQKIFESTSGPKEKKFVLLRKLSNLVSIDYFNALEASVGFAADSIGSAIDRAYSAYRA